MIMLKAHSKAIFCIRFSPDGARLATSSRDDTVRLWSVEPPWLPIQEWLGSGFPVQFTWSSDGRYLGTGGVSVRVWEVGTIAEPLISSNQASKGVYFAPNGASFMAHGLDDYRLNRWAIPSGKPLPGGWGGTRSVNYGQEFPCGGIAVHPQGTTVATVWGVHAPHGVDSVVFLRDAATGMLRGTLRHDNFAAHPTAIRFSPDGSLLAGIYGPDLRVWDVAAEKEIATRNVGKKHFKDLVFLPDGRRLVTVSNDETVRVWDTSNWTEAAAFAWEIGKLGAVAVSPEGDRLAAGSHTGKVIVWDVD